MKNILVPCDFSKASEQALRFAIEIAALSQGEVRVLHVINLTPDYIQTLETNPYYVDSMSILAELKRQAADDFDELMQSKAWAIFTASSLNKLLRVELRSIRTHRETEIVKTHPMRSFLYFKVVKSDL